MPKVSIITPLFNGEKHIASTIRSVMDQTFTDYEHLIIDNGSTDAGAQIVAREAEKDTRIRLLSNPDIPGAAATRNKGIEASEGDIIAFLDADDRWHPDKLERQVRFMSENKIGFSWTSYVSHDDTGKPLRTIRADRCATYEDWLYKRTAIGCLTAAYDTRLFGKRYMKNISMQEDFCLWLDLLKAAQEDGIGVGGLDEPLAYYRVHKGGMTSNKLRSARMQWQTYREHLGLRRSEAAIVFSSYAMQALKARSPFNK